MDKKQKLIWNCRGRIIDCSSRALVMGILNVTPDSFSDGGKFQGVEKGLAHALEMLEQGADIIDVGGESTRPGSDSVPADEEINRTVPVIKAIREKSDCLISIDTTKEKVARAAIEAGADIINDISALSDPNMAKLAAETDAGLVLMHIQGLPKTMQNEPTYGDVLAEVCDFLEELMNFAINQGVKEEQISLDPGIGFGKNDSHNLALLRGIPELSSFERPVLIGVSRKSIFERLLGRAVGDRLAGSLTVAVYSAMKGARVLRVHDVKQSCDAMTILDRLMI